MIPQLETDGLISFDNSYARLPAHFFARLKPTPVAAPHLIQLNEKLASVLNLDAGWLASAEGVAMLSGNKLPPQSEPLAMAYAGHQFGSFVPQLGDGRAILIGEVIGRDGNRRDVQLKGSGPTPFSRSGDGRAALGPVLREYIVSEAMAALGIPTTRSLAAVSTGEPVWRDTRLPGAVLTRVASSHIRVGTFQFFAARGDGDAVRTLADYVIARHYPEVADGTNPYRDLLAEVISRQGELIAKWMLVGFIHGVMNTDNTSTAGETIDYGPCAFMDVYHPETVYSSIDVRGRYAYGNQPRIAQWNLARLAETLLPLLAGDPEAALRYAQEAIDGFSTRFEAAYLAGLRRKLGLMTENAADLTLGQELLKCMAEAGADFTLTFRGLCDETANASGRRFDRDLLAGSKAFDAWAGKWRERLAAEDADAKERRAMMRAANPAVIPRNHLVQEAIAAAEAEGNFAPFRNLLTVLSDPFADRPSPDRYAQPPQPHEIVRATFCGT